MSKRPTNHKLIAQAKFEDDLAVVIDHLKDQPMLLAALWTCLLSDADEGACKLLIALAKLEVGHED